jgi:hypothetical protein
MDPYARYNVVTLTGGRLVELPVENIAAEVAAGRCTTINQNFVARAKPGDALLSYANQTLRDNAISGGTARLVWSA